MNENINIQSLQKKLVKLKFIFLGLDVAFEIRQPGRCRIIRMPDFHSPAHQPVCGAAVGR